MANAGRFTASGRQPGVPLGPSHQGRQRHQYRLRVAAGFQTEHSPPVVEQVELDVAAAADQLMAALLLGPGELHPRPHNSREDAEEGFADRADEREVTLLSAAVEIIEE